MTALGLRWFRSKVYEHREPGRCFMLHGVLARFFFCRGKRLSRATGAHGLGLFEAAIAARGKIRRADAKSDAHADRSDSGKSSID
jgi:hypothetical protein